MNAQEPPSNQPCDRQSPEERLAAVLAEEMQLQKRWLDASDDEEKRQHQARLKHLIETKLALEMEIKRASQEQAIYDNLIPGEELASLLTEGLRARKARPKTTEQPQALEAERLEPAAQDDFSVKALASIVPSTELIHGRDDEALAEPDSGTLFAEQRANRQFILWIILIVVAAMGVFMSQNPHYLQAQFPVSNPILDQKIDYRRLAQSQPQSESQDQIRLLNSEINQLSETLTKKESDMKQGLEAVSQEAQELAGKNGYDAANESLAERQAVYDLIQLVITGKDALARLEQNKAEADLLIQSEEYGEAIQALTDIKLGYQDILRNVDMATPMYLASQQTLQKRADWLAFKKRYELGDLEIEKNANALRWRAKVERDAGQLALAYDDFHKATHAYQNLLAGPEVKEIIAAKQRQPIIASIKEEMVTIPFGSFRMGDLNNEGDINEQPVHEVIISPFLLKKTEVTFAQYDIFADATGRARPSDDGWGRGDRPVINVDWHDAVAYAEWLSKETGEQFRLPTEAEREYAARAGSASRYSWGDTPDPDYANGYEAFGWPSDGYMEQTADVASFKANDFGLYDMHGNAREWTQDCWSLNYERASFTGKAMTEGDCEKRVLRGGSWAEAPSILRSAKRSWSEQDVESSISGFRLAQDLKPSKKAAPNDPQTDSAESL